MKMIYVRRLINIISSGQFFDRMNLIFLPANRWSDVYVFHIMNFNNFKPRAKQLYVIINFEIPVKTSNLVGRNCLESNQVAPNRSYLLFNKET